MLSCEGHPCEAQPEVEVVVVGVVEVVGVVVGKVEVGATVSMQVRRVAGAVKLLRCGNQEFQYRRLSFQICTEVRTVVPAPVAARTNCGSSSSSRRRRNTRKRQQWHPFQTVAWLRGGCSTTPTTAVSRVMVVVRNIQTMVKVVAVLIFTDKKNYQNHPQVPKTCARNY